MKVFDFDPRDNSTRNYIINGNFDFWQRGTSATRTAGNGGYLADRFTNISSSGASKSVTVARSSSVPSSTFPASYSAELTNNTVVSSFAAGEYITGFEHIIEGLFVNPLNSGYVTLGFWLYCTSSMTFPIVFRDGTSSNSYATTVAASAGWKYYAVSLPLSSIVIPYSTARGLSIVMGAVSGSTYQAPSLNSWLAGNYISHASATNWAAGTGVIYRLAQIQLRQGIVSPDDMQNSFSLFSGSYDSEITVCQRYFEKNYPLSISPGTVYSGGFSSSVIAAGTAGESSTPFKTIKRTAPAVTLYSSATGATGVYRDTLASTDRSALVFAADEGGFCSRLQSTSPSTAFYNFYYTADAEF